jgi:hypothetical protein
LGIGGASSFSYPDRNVPYSTFSPVADGGLSWRTENASHIRTLKLNDGTGKEQHMHQIVVDDRVRLQEALPELELAVGEVGRVISAWFFPNTAYEVEFSGDGNASERRVLLLHNQIAGE